MKNLVNFLKMYYHTESTKVFLRTILIDALQTIFFVGGSGLFAAIFRGLYYRIFLKYNYPALIGRGFKIISPSNFSAGHHIWFKDYVSLLAAGQISLGDNNVLCERVSIWSHEKGVKIGTNVAIGIGSYICGTGGMIEIGNEVRIADSVRIYSFNHKYNRVGVPIAKQGYTAKGIKIADNVWIGSGTVILDGVTIGSNSIIAAGSVVTKDIPKCCVAAGVPAKVIKRMDSK